jgi:hypothetical protein
VTSGDAARDPVLASAERGDLVGVVAVCPRFGCDWREEHASAEVVNEHGVRDVVPSRCGVHRDTHVRVERIVEVIR